ncbi:MAG: 50S ribosomal protein L23 [Nitrospirae bacterium]|nr:50S ribosomal protein L23 [Candidatus Troglogloeales bacterium]MBI3598130.1 50S ribosomal protein L23 [Candidatus Troglogloeales bacterium]
MNRHDIIVSPLVTEKSTLLRETFNQYCFVVRPDVNRSEVKKALEETLSVKITKVRMMNVMGKEKRLNRFIGRRPDWKKAVVTLKEGQKLTIFEG